MHPPGEKLCANPIGRDELLAVIWSLSRRERIAKPAPASRNFFEVNSHY